MIAKRTRPNLELSDKEIKMLRLLSLSRTFPHDRVTKANILLAHHDGETKSSISLRIGVSRPTVDLCIRKAFRVESTLPFGI